MKEKLIKPNSSNTYLNAFATVFVVFAANCGESSQTSSERLAATRVGCDFFTAAQCWRAAVDEAASCLQSESGIAQFNTTRTECSYAGGAKIEFSQPVPFDPQDEMSFTILSDGVCAEYSRNGGQISLETASGLVSFSMNETSGQMSCPGGALYTFSTIDVLQQCAFDGVLPGSSASGIGGHLRFALGGGTEGIAQLFSCNPI